MPKKEIIKRYRLLYFGHGQKRVHEHRLRAARALGRALPSGAEVHHVDGSKSERSDLVICQDAAYHKLLHRRMRIRAMGGNPNTDSICAKCKQVKPLGDFTMVRGRSKGGPTLRPHGYCKPCAIRSNREWVARRASAA